MSGNDRSDDGGVAFTKLIIWLVATGCLATTAWHCFGEPGMYGTWGVSLALLVWKG